MNVDLNAEISFNPKSVLRTSRAYVHLFNHLFSTTGLIRIAPIRQ